MGGGGGGGSNFSDYVLIVVRSLHLLGGGGGLGALPKGSKYVVSLINWSPAPLPPSKHIFLHHCNAHPDLGA